MTDGVTDACQVTGMAAFFGCPKRQAGTTARISILNAVAYAQRIGTNFQCLEPRESTRAPKLCLLDRHKRPLFSYHFLPFLRSSSFSLSS